MKMDNRILRGIIDEQVVRCLKEHTTTQRDRDEYRSKVNIQNAVESGELEAMDILDFLFKVVKEYGLSFVEVADALIGGSDEEGFDEEY